MDNFSCPSCGDGLHDVSEDVQVDESTFEVLDSLLKYYCENCGDFYGKESLKEEMFTQ